MPTILSAPLSTGNFNPVQGPNVSLVWIFNDADLVNVTPTKTVITVEIVSGVSTGSLILDGITFTATSVGPNYNATFFKVNATSAIETAENLKKAIKSNLYTSTKWDVEISGDVNNATVTLTNKIAGVQAGATVENTTPDYLTTLTQGSVGVVLDKFFFVYQAFFTDKNCKEIEIMPLQKIPAYYDYYNGQLPQIRVNLAESVRAFLQTIYPSRFSSTPRAEIEATAKIGIRLGTIRYSGCTIVSQDMFFDDNYYGLNSCSDFFDAEAPFNYAPGWNGNTPAKILNVGALVCPPMTTQVSGWLYVWFNGIYGGQTQIHPAYKYKFYDKDGNLLNETAVISIFPSNNCYECFLFRVPYGPWEIAPYLNGNEYKVEVIIGFLDTNTDIFIQQYEKYEYLIFSHCVVAEIHFLSYRGAWETITFQEILSESFSVEQDEVNSNNPAKMLVGSLNSSYRRMIDWVDKAGRTQINTASYKKMKLRNKLLDQSKESKAFFEAFLKSEHRKIVIKKAKAQNTEDYIISAPILSLISDFEFFNENGKGKYDVEIIFAQASESLNR